jgi:hypothetical protein
MTRDLGWVDIIIERRIGARRSCQPFIISMSGLTPRINSGHKVIGLIKYTLRV